MVEKEIIKDIKILVFVLLFVCFLIGVVWIVFINRPLGGIYTDGYHVELRKTEKEVTSLLKSIPLIVNNNLKLSLYCYQVDSVENNIKYVYFEYDVQNITYLHVCLLTTTWDSKTLLVYYNVVKEDCFSENINNQLKNKEEFINEFNKKILNPLGLL